MRVKRTFKETISDHERQIAWQKKVIKEDYIKQEKMKDGVKK